MGNILCNSADEGTQGIVIFFNEGKGNLLGVTPQAISSCPVLGEGVDVGIVPKTGHIKPVSTQNLNALVGARGAANMQ
jgi:hypothetical protein